MLKLKFQRLHETVVRSVNADPIIDHLFTVGIIGVDDMHWLQLQGSRRQQCRSLLCLLQCGRKMEGKRTRGKPRREMSDLLMEQEDKKFSYEELKRRAVLTTVWKEDGRKTGARKTKKGDVGSTYGARGQEDQPRGVEEKS